MSGSTKQTRRGVVGGLAAGIGGATLADGGITPALGRTDAKTFVLVHGAWHGGWCWRRVADLLERGGHKVFAPTLTGLGERSHLLSPNVTLGTHITDIVNVIKWEGLSDIVLCGHSYGGAVVTGVAEQAQPAISSIVFLDAFVPEDGETLLGLASPPTRDAINGALQRGETILKPVPASVFRVNEKDRAWVDSMCVPQPLATFTDKVTVTGARERIAKKSYIRAKGYPSQSFDEAQAKVTKKSGWQIYEMPSGHDAMVDMPERLAEILLEVA